MRRFLEDLGYVVHTPWQVFGSRHDAQGTADAVWLARCGQGGWAAIAKDTRILERPDELAARRLAKIHIFYYPGNATRNELLAAAAATLIGVCTAASAGGGGAWRVRGGTNPRIDQIKI